MTLRATLPPERPADAPLRPRSRCSTTTSTTGSATTRSRSCCATARAGSTAIPSARLIVRRYLKHQRGLVRDAHRAPARRRSSPRTRPPPPRRTRRRRRSSGRSACNEQRLDAVLAVLQGVGRDARARPRLRRGQAAARAAGRSRSSTRSSAWTSSAARSRSPERACKLDRLPPKQRERIRCSTARSSTATAGSPASTRRRSSR